MKTSRKLFGALTAGALAAGSLTAGAQLVDFQSLKFYHTPGNNYNNYVATGGAVLGTSSDVGWNEFGGDSGGNPLGDVLSNVHDSTGASTGITIAAQFARDFTGDGSSDGGLNPAVFDYALGSSPFYGNTTYFPPGSPNNPSPTLDGASDNPDSLDFSGLADNQLYNLVLYSNNKSGGRGFLLTGGGADVILDDNIATTYTSNVDLTQTINNGVLTYSGNYIEVQVTSDASGNLDMTLQDGDQFDQNGDPTQYELDLAGGQLQKVVPVVAPEPTTNALMALGAGLLGLFGYRKRASLR